MPRDLNVHTDYKLLLHANNEELLWDIGVLSFSETTVHPYNTVHHGYMSFHLDPRLLIKHF
jgi:hypothetical protein